MRQSSAEPAGDETAHRGGSKRHKMFRLLAAGIPTVIGLAIVIAVLVAQERLVLDAETGWIRLQSPRVYLYEPGYELTGHRYIYDSVLGWRNIPAWQATTFGHKLTINSKGLRDREIPFKKPADTKRVLVLGDSFAWGYGVADDQTFAKQLEEQLAGTSPDWEVLNTGVSGWGTDQQYLYLTREGFQYDPDIVVLAFFLVNDPHNNSQSVQYGLYKPVFLTNDLQLANTPVPKPQSEAPLIQSQSEPLEITFYILQAMAQACAERNSQLVIMKFGTFLRRDDRSFHAMDQAYKLLIQRGLPGTPFLDLDEQFAARQISTETLLEGNDDGHWNAFGHRLTAQILHQFLAQSELVQ